jgi:hypothetical protein
MAQSAAKLALGLLLATASCLAARAADLSPQSETAVPPPPLFSGWEVRGGVYDHDPWSPERGSADLNGELLAPQPFQGSSPFWSQFIPHPDIGFTANFFGKTSNLYGGAAWNFDLTRRIFLSSDFGLGVNNGKTGLFVPPGHNPIGCNWWFHESETAGYRLTDAWSVMATIEHSSNAGFCAKNRGLTNAGLRLGYRF